MATTTPEPDKAQDSEQQKFTTRIDASVEQLSKAYNARYSSIPDVSYELLPTDYIKALIMVIVNSISITPNGLALHDDTATSFAILATDAGIDPKGEAVAEVEKLMDMAITVHTRYGIFSMIKKLQQALYTEQSMTNREIEMMIDDAVVVGQLLTTSQIVGDQLQRTGLITKTPSKKDIAKLEKQLIDQKDSRLDPDKGLTPEAGIKLAGTDTLPEKPAQ